MNRLVFLFFVTLFIALFTAQVNALSLTTVRLTEAQIQQTVTALMPLEREKYFIKATFTDPVVKLIPVSNKLSVRANVQVVAMKTMRGSGYVEITGGLRYSAEQGAFYLQDPVISSMHVNRLASQFQAQVKNLAQSALVNTFSSRPVYTLNDNDTRQKLAKSALKSVRIEKSELVAEFGLF